MIRLTNLPLEVMEEHKVKSGVLTVVADCYFEHDGDIGVRALVAETGVDHRMVKRCTSALVDIGFLRPVKTAVGGRVIYRIGDHAETYIDKDIANQEFNAFYEDMRRFWGGADVLKHLPPKIVMKAYVKGNDVSWRVHREVWEAIGASPKKAEKANIAGWVAKFYENHLSNKTPYAEGKTLEQAYKAKMNEPKQDFVPWDEASNNRHKVFMEAMELANKDALRVNAHKDAGSF